MSLRGLQFATLNIPLGAGLDQGTGDHVRNPPALDRCVDAEFDEMGQLRTRYPFASIGNAIFGGGTLSNARKLVANDNELLCFTKDSLYSWSPELSAWVSKGAHLAVANDETPRFVSTGDQTGCDRAELNGTIVYAWLDNTTAYAAAIDKTSGAVIVAPTALGNQASGTTFVSLVALSTKILLFSRVTGVGFVVRAIDPASPSAGIASVATSILVSGSGAGTYFDVARVPSADTAIFVSTRLPSTSFEVGTVTAGLVVTKATKARAAIGPVAIAVTPDATKAQIVRRKDASDLKGDLINASTLADVSADQAIVTAGLSATSMNVTAVYSTAQVGGQYVCYLLWDEEDTKAATAAGVQGMTIDTAGTVATVFYRQGPYALASHAFAHDGGVYANVVFDGLSQFNSFATSTTAALQNTVFLYRIDVDDSGGTLQTGRLIGKSLVGIAGGYPTVGFLPHVASTDTNEYSWCGVERRVVPLGTDYNGYADRGPRDIVTTFDTNEARRCVRLGETLYITGAEIKQYDGSGLYEVGFHYFPYYFEGSTPGSGGLSAGTYGYKLSYRWENARGETERSTTATIGTVTTAASDQVELTNIGALGATHKGDEPAIEVWRTLVDPTDDAPYYLVSNNDPTDTAGANCYLANSSGYPVWNTGSGWDDQMSDATAATKETNPENLGVLECLPPPPATVIAASQDRIFLAGIPGDRDRVWYSRLRGDGEIASFHDSLTFAVPSAGGAITGLAFLNETLIVFRETAIYAFPGDGYGNDGSGINYGPSRTLSTDIGATTAESIATIEQGLIFKSSKGWYVLNRGWAVDYIGSPVADYDSEEPLAVHVLTSRHQVRILTGSRMLVLDTLLNQWGEWSIASGLDACIWNGSHHYLTATDIKAEQSAYSSLTYGMDIETAWVKLDQLQGFGRVRKIQIQGEYRSAHNLRLRLARDYWIDGVNTYFDDDTWTVTPTTVGGPEQVRIGPSIQQMGAVKIRITPGMVIDAVAASGSLLGNSELGDIGRMSFVAKNTGTVGNSYTIHFIPDGTGAGTYVDGANAVYHFQADVTTVANILTAMAGSAYFTASVLTAGVRHSDTTVTLSGGVDAYNGPPTGEALKLSGIALEIGVKRSPYPQLPAGQKT